MSLAVSKHQTPAMSPRSLRLLRRPSVLGTYDALRAINPAADADLPILLQAILEHETQVVGWVGYKNVRGSQMLDFGAVDDEENPVEKKLREWESGFLDTVQEWKNEVRDYVAGVTKYELFRHALSDETRRGVLQRLAGKPTPSLEPGQTFMLLEATDATPYLLGQLDGNLSLREILQLFYGRHSSGTTPQTSQRWPFFVRPGKNDPVGIYSRKVPRPMLAYFSRRDAKADDIMAQPDLNNFPIAIDGLIGKSLYLRFLNERVARLPSWDMTWNMYRRRQLLMLGQPEVEALIEDTLNRHESLPSALRSLKSDQAVWKHSPEVAAILAREEQLLGLIQRPTLCGAGLFREMYHSTMDEQTGSLRGLIRHFVLASVRDVFAPWEVRDWRPFVAAQDEITAQKKERRATRLLKERLARTDKEIASPKAVLLTDEESALAPDKAEVLRKRRERKYLKKLEGQKRRDEQALERIKSKYFLPKPPPKSDQEIQEERERKRKHAQTRRATYEAKGEKLRREKAARREEELLFALTHQQKPPVRRPKTETISAPKEKKRHSRSNHVPASKKEYLSLRAARRWQREQRAKPPQP